MESNSSNLSNVRDGEDDVTRVEHYDLPVLKKERTREIAVPNVTEQVIPVPHIQYIERIEEVPRTHHVSKYVTRPQVEITERIIEIPKPVKQENVVTVPHIQVVDRIVEVPQYITKEKVVEKPKVLIQERLIPLPKRTIEEKVVEIPENEYEKILQEKVHQSSPEFNLNLCNSYEEDDVMVKEQRQRGGPIDEVVVIPHVQHLYRNIVEPVFRHIPKPIEIPLTHYTPVPIEHIVDRNVPIPVELEVTQEFLCPRLIPKYVEVPVAVQVTRCIERPVPVDAMLNSVIMDGYFTETEQRQCLVSCAKDYFKQKKPQQATRMGRKELLSVGIGKTPSLSDVQEFKSRGFSNPGVNIKKSKHFFFRESTIPQ